MASIFTKIIAGDIPCHKLAENEKFFSFLDIRPICEGHALVIPKLEIDKFFDLDDELLSEIMVFAKPLAAAIEKVVPCKRVGVVVAGIEVPHAHVHLIPINAIADLSFANAKPADQAELARLCERIVAALAE